jgi:electron transport complex protein RnfC
MSNSSGSNVEVLLRSDGFIGLPAPARLHVPSSAEPAASRTRVKRGEPVSDDAPGCLSPVDGTIAGASREHELGGAQIDTVIIETAAGNKASLATQVASPEHARKMLSQLKKIERPELADQLAGAGIKANRWTGPDFIAQLRDEGRKPLKAVLCAALDLDSVLPLQQALVSTRATEIAAGVMALAILSGAGRGLLALPEDSPPHVVAATRAAAAATGLRLYPLPDEYPLAHPSLLIHRILHRRLPHRRLPTDTGVIFLDAPTAVALGRFFLHDEPMLEVPLGVYDRGLAKAHLIWVPIGAKLRDVLRAINIAPAAVDLRVGHLLRDLHTNADVVIGAGELTVLAAETQARPPAAACLRCGWCVEACPVQIHPAGLLEAAQQQDIVMADRFGLQSCIECGVCSYVCPSRLPLLGAIRGMNPDRTSNR